MTNNQRVKKQLDLVFKHLTSKVALGSWESAPHAMWSFATTNYFFH